MATATGIVLWEFNRQQIAKFGSDHPDLIPAEVEDRKYVWTDPPAQNTRSGAKKGRNSTETQVD